MGWFKEKEVNWVVFDSDNKRIMRDVLKRESDVFYLIDLIADRYTDSNGERYSCEDIQTLDECVDFLEDVCGYDLISVSERTIEALRNLSGHDKWIRSSVCARRIPELSGCY